jgi:hypothetical protein
MQTQITVSDLRRRFCDYVLDWKRTGKLELFIEVDDKYAVFANQIVEALTTADDAVPDNVAAALGLAAGASYADATIPVLKAFHEPIVPTPEEEAEFEAFALKASEIFETLNSQNPDMPPLPVVYPKATRQKQ